MMNISLVFFVVKTFKFLNFGNSSQSTGGHNLSHTSREYRAAVNSGKDSVFAPDRSDFGERSAVRSYARVRDLRSDFFFGYIIKRILDFSRHIGELLREMFKAVFLNLVLTILSFHSVERIESVIEFFARVSADCRVEILGNVIKFHFKFLLAAFFDDAFDESALLFDFFVTEKNRADHCFVVDFLSARFNHHYRVLRSRKVKSKRTLLFLSDGGVDNVFAVDDADDYRTRRSCPRNIGNAERDGTAEHCKRLGSDIGINGKSRGNDGYVIEKPLGEKRSDRSVDKS